MPIDYAKIREENIIRYGTDIAEYGPTLLENLYSDQTHFIYELLQNAEDAGATEVRFRLTPECLEFEHDGRLFNEADVRGICALAKGTKKDDLTKIGKFGIGFKSVYAHTKSPEIHCGAEHFVVRNYVHPHNVECRLSDSGTLFVFPFNRPDTKREDSYDAISRRLRNLDIRTLLFLSNISNIEYEVQEEASGFYMRQLDKTLAENFATIVKLLGQKISHHEVEENWLVFSRDAAALTEDSGLPLNVEVAFLLSGEEQVDTLRIRPCSESNLFVYFPTEKQTRVDFLIQGPYRDKYGARRHPA